MRVKMNKFITFLFLLMCSFSVQANDDVNDEILLIDDSAVEAGSDFKANYTIEIPKSIYMQKSESDKTYEATYSVKVANLDATDERSCLAIEPDAEFQLSAVNKNPITVYVEQEETEFSNLLQDDLSVMHMTTGYLYTKEPLSSAEWNGSFSFYISLIDLGESQVTTFSMANTVVDVATSSNAMKVETEEVVIEEELENDLETEIEIATPSEAEKVENEVVDDGNCDLEDDVNIGTDDSDEQDEPGDFIDDSDYETDEDIEESDEEIEESDDYEPVEDADDSDEDTHFIATDSNATKYEPEADDADGSNDFEPDTDDTDNVETDDGLEEDNQSDTDFEEGVVDDNTETGTDDLQEEEPVEESEQEPVDDVIADVSTKDEEEEISDSEEDNSKQESGDESDEQQESETEDETEEIPDDSNVEEQQSE